MLRPVSPGPAIVVCSTCRRPVADRPAGADAPDGALLIEMLLSVQAEDARFASIAIQRMPCLFACSDACTIHLRAPGHIGYVLGRFAPDPDAARAILEFAVAHAESAIGEVPFAQWPEGVKGHFITRTPPEGYVVD